MGRHVSRPKMDAVTPADTAALQAADRTRLSLSIGPYTLESGVTLPDVVVG
jgi:hypothetical protein